MRGMMQLDELIAYSNNNGANVMPDKSKHDPGRG
jgi:hypothetical protein